MAYTILKAVYTSMFLKHNLRWGHNIPNSNFGKYSNVSVLHITLSPEQNLNMLFFWYDRKYFAETLFLKSIIFLEQKLWIILYNHTL
jgi:hypothetical protein